MAGEVVDRWDDGEEDHLVRDSSLVDKTVRLLTSLHTLTPTETITGGWELVCLSVNFVPFSTQFVPFSVKELLPQPRIVALGKGCGMKPSSPTPV